MIEFGKTLRAAREAKGYTASQISEITHMAPTTIAELESDDFSHIAAPIYGRGFIKLYCEAVGIDPKPLINEFMDIINGKHDTEIRERPFNPAPKSQPVPEEPAPEPQPEPAPEPQPEPASQLDLFGSTNTENEPQPRIAPIPPVSAEPLIQRRPQSPAPAKPVETSEAQSIPDEPPPLENSNPSPYRYATPMRQSPVPSFGPSVWRMAVLGAVAIVVLWLLLYGVRALYRATAPANNEPETSLTASTTPASERPADSAPTAKKVPVATAPVSVAPTPKPAARTPQKLPSLYID